MKNDQVQSLAIAREAVDHAARFRQRNAGDIRGLETLAAASFQLAWRSPRTEQVGLWKGVLEHYERLLRSDRQPRSPSGMWHWSKSILPACCLEISPRPITDVRWTWTKSDCGGPRQSPGAADTAISIAGWPIFSNSRETSMKRRGS